MNSINEYVKTKPYLVWYTKNYNELSEKSIVESVLNYGNWEDYLFVERSLGINETKTIFNFLKDQKRTNLRPQTINYFSNYFNKYA
jgi:hypothetical protein